MILDTSAIVAMLFEEPGHESLQLHARAAPSLSAGTPTLVESGLVLSRRYRAATRSVLARFVESTATTILPFESRHHELAVDAFLRYGKGRGPAGLNFGDCMTYAVAKHAGEPLLCAGDDFAKTDLELVV